MAKKNSYITVTDLFCGAGGSSQGVRNLGNRMNGGVEVKLALNHWKLAIETHNTNFPDALHDCADISNSDPRRYPSTDGLIGSPECTANSPAGGNRHIKQRKQFNLFETTNIDPATVRSRATMWDIPRFTEYHKYNFIVVENVVEAKTTWPLFDHWLGAMQILGYHHRCVYANSMHFHPTPQSRDRMYVVFWKKGNKAPMLDYTPSAYCPKCEQDVSSVQCWKNKLKPYGKYRQQYVYCCPKCSTIVEPYYYASFNMIDWTDPGKRIGDRKVALAVNTEKRIRYGLDKYGKTPMIVTTKYHSEAIELGARSAMDTMRTQTTEQAHAILNPFLIDDKQTTGINFRVRGVDNTVNTLHTSPNVKLVHMPFIVKLEHSQRNNNVTGVADAAQTQTVRQSGMLIQNVRSSTDALQTQTTTQGMGFCVPPFMTVLQGTGKTNLATNAHKTITSGGVHSGIVTTECWNSFLTSYNTGSHCTKHITEEMGTVTTGERNSIINYQVPEYEECYYRMLKAGEIKLGMAFDWDYKVLGSNRNQVKQLGNAVTPPVMEWLVQQCVKSLS